jgi:hypothetical protein
VQSLSALPAVLATPALCVAAGGGPPGAGDEASGLAVCSAVIAARPEVQWRRVHADCGRPVSRASLGLGDLFGDEEPADELHGEA